MTTQPTPTSIFDEYATDVQLEEQGVPITLRNGAVITLRSENSLTARKWLTRRVKAQRGLIAANKGILPPEVNDQNDIDELAEALITGWTGVRGRAGEEIPYSVATARQLMTQLPVLRRELLMAARTDETFRRELLEELSGNSSPPSAPDSGSAGGSSSS